MTAEQIKVQTNDGHVLEVDETVAKKWGLIKNLIELTGNVSDLPQPVQLTDISSTILPKIVEWTKQHLTDPQLNEPLDENQRKRIDIPQWDRQFLDIDQAIILGIMVGANYLDLQLLVEMTCKKVADMIRDKTPEQVRQTFRLVNDLPPPPPIPEVPQILPTA